MPIDRRTCLFLFTSLAISRSAVAVVPAAALVAPNVVEISSRLVTSGQPSVTALATLGALGFGADIYLAPSTVPDAVADEASIVAGQGIAFVHIPIKFNTPSEDDFTAFANALERLRDRKILVHCQVNMRASSMVFLHRVIVGKEDPQVAYESVAKVWSPDGNWRRFIVFMLQKNNIGFEPY